MQSPRAVGHSHVRFIPLVVLIMSTFYLLCKAGRHRAHNKCDSAAINLEDWIGGDGFRPVLPIDFPFFLPLSLSLFTPALSSSAWHCVRGLVLLVTVDSAPRISVSVQTKTSSDVPPSVNLSPPFAHFPSSIHCFFSFI